MCTYTSDHDYHKFWVHPNATKVTETGVQCQPGCENKFQQTNHVQQTVDAITKVQKATQVTTTSRLLQIKCRQQQKLITELSSKLQTVNKEKETLKYELSKHKFCVETLWDSDICVYIYGGAASDRFIVNKSGILNLVKDGDNVMADRGFDISDDLKKCGATLNIPPFRCGEFQLSASQVEETRRIAEVRIHVERAIQRIKTFHILNGTMPVTQQWLQRTFLKSVPT
ncbi:unnamed protein product [Mytilus coruscus]|uniref:DDE Tnp4 domain-containing protein n=1 Tax=Mytilus coruscus TaxID=42192 RepID=A0A6J8BJ65_MYTCO|nr:unnamed protein product [Mytilus coruscus]